MTDQTTTPKRKAGRPRKISPDVRIEGLQRQIDRMQDELAEKQRMTLATTPPAGQDLPPGSLYLTGYDGSGSPQYSKVAWTRADLVRVFGEVTFTPKKDLTVGPMGLPYYLRADEEVTVPGIAKQIHDDTIANEKAEAKKYKPWSSAEDSQLSAQALEAPGTQQWSRLARIGQGLAVRSATPGAAAGEIPGAD